MGGCEQCMGNRLSGLYNKRQKMVTGAKNILGTAKSGIRIIGKANQFSKKIGVPSNSMNNMSNALQQFAYPDVA